MNWIARSTAILGLITAGVAPQIALAAEEGVHDPREIAPEAIIGYWKADLDASTYEYTKPAAAIRSFSFTEDGKVLVAFATQSASGNLTFGHWAAQVDGTPGIEYHSSAGSVPYNVVAWKVTGEGRLELDVSRGGETTIEATYQLSADGNTLEYSYGGTTIVYRRWNLVD